MKSALPQENTLTKQL